MTTSDSPRLPICETTPSHSTWGALIHQFDEHGRHEVPLAGSSQRNIAHIEGRWKAYCSDAGLGDPRGALQNARPSHFKAFFQWLVANADRSPQQSISLKSYFRRMKQIYKMATGSDMEAEMVCDVYAFIDYHLKGKKESSPRAKPVPSGQDFVQMLHFLYQGDTTGYPDERQRVQQAFLMLVHGYSGLRPSSTTGSTVGEAKLSAAEEEMMAKLRYCDFTLSLMRDTDGTLRFGVRPLFIHFKNDLKRKQRKKLTWWDQADAFTCPVAHLVALAISDNAFYPPGLNNASGIFSLRLPPGRDRLVLRWSEHAAKRPILRTTAKGKDDVELSNNIAAKRLSNLGRKSGYEEDLTWYCLRRMVLNAVDGVGSDELRNQLAGHLDSRTYRMHYQDQHINLDVANLVKNQPTEDALTRKATSMGVNRDPRANVALPADFDEQIAALPDMVALEVESKKLMSSIRQKYGFMTQAPASDPLVERRNDIDKQRRRKKEAYRTQKKAELRKAYFVQRDLAIVEAQLTGNGNLDVGEPTREAPPELIPERARLVELMDVKDSRSPAKRAEVVQAMVELCSRVVKTCRHGGKRISASPASRLGRHETQEEPSHPMLCHALQCLFCLGDERLFRAHQIKKYNRQAALWKHAKGHLDALEVSRDFRCPHPLCRTADVTLESVEHLLNHAQTKHGIRLRCR